jgi:hypothetical protein
MDTQTVEYKTYIVFGNVTCSDFDKILNKSAKEGWTFVNYYNEEEQRNRAIFIFQRRVNQMMILG